MWNPSMDFLKNQGIYTLFSSRQRRQRADGEDTNMWCHVHVKNISLVMTKEILNALRCTGMERVQFGPDRYHTVVVWHQHYIYYDTSILCSERATSGQTLKKKTKWTSNKNRYLRFGMETSTVAKQKKRKTFRFIDMSWYSTPRRVSFGGRERCRYFDVD